MAKNKYSFEEKDKSKGVKIIAIISLIVALIAGGVAVYFVLLNKPAEQSEEVVRTQFTIDYVFTLMSGKSQCFYTTLVKKTDFP